MAATVTIPSFDLPIYVLGTDRNLWIETPVKPYVAIPPKRTQVDGNVQNFEAIDANNIYVLGTDRTLWLETAPFGTVPQQQRTRIGDNVVEFDGLAFNGLPLNINSKRAIYVLDVDGNLWLERFQESPRISKQVDRNVLAFAAVDENNVFVLGTDRNLWLETATEKVPFGSQIPPLRKQVDGNVLDFEIIDVSNVYVLGTDRNLWLETATENVPFGTQVPPPRTHIDGNVKGCQAIPGSSVFVLGTDNKLWLEFPDYGPQNRAQVDGNVQAFQSIGSADNILVLGTDNKLWFEQGPFKRNGPVPPLRVQIDGNVLDFSDVNPNRG